MLFFILIGLYIVVPSFLLFNLTDMSETGEKKPNVEGVTQSKGSSSRVELAEIQNGLAKAVASPNPSKAPLNYIDNLDERKVVQKEQLKQLAQKQRELEAILQLSDDKDEEIGLYREEMAKLDIELQKTMGSMEFLLSKHVEFLQYIEEKLTSGAEKKLADSQPEAAEPDSQNEENVESEESQNTISLRLFLVEKDGQKIVRAVCPVEITDKQKEIMTQGIIEGFLGKGVKVAGVEYEIQPIEDAVEESEDDSQFQGNDIISQEEVSNLEELSPVLQSFFLLTNPKIIECFESILDENDKRGLKNLRENLEKLSDKYNELLKQIKNISDKIDSLEDEQEEIDEKSVEYEQGVSDLYENIGKINQGYFLNSYQSTKKVSLDDFVATPTVERQVNYILELNKRGLPMPKTILLYGGHNLGKTYTANVLATELNRKMYHIKSCDIKNSEFSDAGAMLDAIFSGAIDRKEPCIIFLDEIEKFSKGLEGSIYQDEIENTIRHHISKIKESSLDIIIIGAISDKSKIDPSLMKQDIFSKQIDFEPLSDDKCTILFQKILAKKKLQLGEEVILQETISKISEKNPEYIKKLVEEIANCHLLNTLDSENNIISQDDIDEAFKIMGAYSRNSSGHTGFTK